MNGEERVEKEIRWVWLRQLLVPLAVLLLVGNAIMVPILFAKVNAAAEDNCVRVHRVVHALDGLLVSSRPRLMQLEKEGTLTHAQLVRALKDNTQQRKTLSGADCPTPPPRP